MKPFPELKLVVLLTVLLPGHLLSVAQDDKGQGWPWQLHVSKHDALKVTGFGSFTQKKENEFQSEPNIFLGEKAVTTLFFGDKGLDTVRVEVYRGNDKEKALDSWCRLFAWQKARNGEVVTFDGNISRKADDSEVRKKTEDWLAGKPKDKVVKLYTNCFEKRAPGRFVTFLVRTPGDYLVYTVYGGL